MNPFKPAMLADTAEQWLTISISRPQPPPVKYLFCSMSFIKADRFAQFLHLAVRRGHTLLLVVCEHAFAFFPQQFRRFHLRHVFCPSPRCCLLLLHKPTTALHSRRERQSGASKRSSNLNWDFNIWYYQPSSCMFFWLPQLLITKAQGENTVIPSLYVIIILDSDSNLFQLSPRAAFDSTPNPVRLLGHKPSSIQCSESIVWYGLSSRWAGRAHAS